MAEAQEKANALEKAVKIIEENILKAFPGYNEKNFKVEWKKRIVVDEVTHEIDVWVDIEIGPGYSSRVIFECKNRREKADKNDVIVLAEKVEVTQAQNGFLVARHFTKDAEAQARKNPRIKLVIATDLLETNILGFPYSCMVVNHEAQHYGIEKVVFGQQTPPNLQTVLCDTARVSGIGFEPCLFEDYVKKWGAELCKYANSEFTKGTPSSGLHTLEHYETRTLNNLVCVEGFPIQSMTLRGIFKVQVILPSVVSHFDVSTRGRVLTFALVEMDGFEFTASFIATASPKNQPSQE